MNDDQLDLAVARFLDARRDEIVAAARPAAQAAARAGVRPRAAGRPGARPVLLWMALLGLLIAALLAAAITGGDPLRAPDPLPGNGLIGYGLTDLEQRPGQTVRVVAPDGTGDRAIGPGTGQTFSADGRVLAYWAGAWPDQVLTVVPSDGSPRAVPGVEATSRRPCRPTARRSHGSRRSNRSPSRARTDRADRLVPSTSCGSVRPTVPPADWSCAQSDDPFVWYSSPVWSPDGRSIAFALNRSVITDGGGWSYRSAIDVVRLDGPAPSVRVLTHHPGSDSGSHSWSPDGRHLAYTALPAEVTPSPVPVGDEYQRYQGDDIFVITVDGTDERNLTDSPDGEFDPRWSPDGSHIAWSGEGGLRVQQMDDAQPVGAPVVMADIRDEWVWSPDGTRIGYSWYEEPASGSVSGGQVIVAGIRSVPVSVPQASPTPILDVTYLVQGLSWQALPPGASAPHPSPGDATAD